MGSTRGQQARRTDDAWCPKSGPLRRRWLQDPFIWFLLERAYGYAGRVRKATYSELFYRTIHDHRWAGPPVARRPCVGRAG